MKKKMVGKEFGEGLGNSGFTLGVLSLIFTGFAGVIIGIVGIIFSKIQQKNNPTKLGRIGFILNLIGIILGIVFMFAYYAYILPAIQQLMSSIPLA